MLLEVLVTAGDGSGLAGLAADGSSVASIATSIRLRFDRFLDPRTALRQAICLRASDQPAAQPADCVGGVSLKPRYDPVRRELIFHIEAPEAETFGLLNDTVYRLDVYEAAEPGDFGVRAIGGAALALPSVFVFRTATPTPAPLGPEAAPVADAAMCASIDTLLFKQCKACHDDAAPTAPMGLTLAGPASLPPLFGRAAKGSQHGADAEGAASTPLRFGASMALVAPGDAGQSYLLYKILLGNPGGDIPEAELELLRAVIPGMAMPADRFKPDENALVPGPSLEQIQALSDFIAAGALCP